MTPLSPTPEALDGADEATPEYASRLGLVPAGPGFRSLAFAIDAAVWLALFSPAAIGAVLLAGGDASVLTIVMLIAGSALPTLFGLVQLILHGRRGVTLGKAAMRLRSVSAVDYGRPGFWRVVLRALVLWVSGIVPIAGPAVLLSSGLWDRQGRGRSILDRIGGCWLVDCRAGLDPFDAKALRHARRTLRGRPDDTEELPSMASGVSGESALRIPGARSRSGVVGPGSTGAQWEVAADSSAVFEGVIADVPGAAPAAAEPAPLPSPPAPTDAPAPTHAAPATAPAVATVDAAAPAVPTRRAQAMVRFDDGSIVRVPGTALIGRDPEAAADEQVDALVRLDDPERLMSKTHAAFGQDRDGVWITDRGSRNGTLLRAPGGETVEVPAGEHVRVPVGWTAHVGGRSFELLARGADS